MRLRLGQQQLTNAQKIASRQFVEERIRAQLATTEVDEPAAEALLAQAYEAAGFASPHHIHWLDGPLELVAVLARSDDWHTVDEPYRERVPHCVWDDSVMEGDEIGKLGVVGAESIDHRIRRVARGVETRLKGT